MLMICYWLERRVGLVRRRKTIKIITIISIRRDKKKREHQLARCTGP